jgi:AbrB family looped-hinge helix DNA binding protein
MTSKGQVTIPAEIRKALGLKPRDKVSFRVENGHVHLEPTVLSVMDSAGKFKVRGFKNMKQLRRETAERVAERTLKRAGT